MAQDETLKRQSMIRRSIADSAAILNAISDLANIATEESKLILDFQAADFTPSDLTHLIPAQVSTLLQFVLPSLQTALADAADGGRNIQILTQMLNS